jgi:hypothetical protein
VTVQRGYGKGTLNVASNPLNLALRFALELAALVAMGMWGYRQADGLAGIALAVAVPLVGAALWGTFRAHGGASHSGKAPVPVPGIVRLALELAWFAFAAWALYDVGRVTLSVALAVIVAAHYIVSFDRVLWLIRGNGA